MMTIPSAIIVIRMSKPSGAELAVPLLLLVVGSAAFEIALVTAPAIAEPNGLPDGNGVIESFDTVVGPVKPGSVGNGGSVSPFIVSPRVLERIC